MSVTSDLQKTLVQAGRVLASEGQGDYVAGHVSARIGSSGFLMKPAGIGLEEMNDHNVITVDFEGERIAGSLPRHNEVYIHSEILKRRPEVNAVVHTHPIHAVAFSSLGEALLPLCADATIFGVVKVYDETTDLIVTPERGASVANCIGTDVALILQNHGIVTAGRTIEEAVYYALKLEQACKIQLMASWAGGPKHHASDADALQRGERNRRPDLFQNVFDYAHRCACRKMGIGNDVGEPLSPKAMQGRFDRK